MSGPRARLCAVLAGCGEDQVAIRAAGIVGAAAGPRRAAPRPAAVGAGRDGAGDRRDRGAGRARGPVAGRARAPRVVLASRSGPAAAGAAGLAADLAAAGTAAEVVACDVAERARVAGLLARIAAGAPRLAAVLHAAGVLDDGVLDGLDAGRLASVLAAKAGGAAHLDELTAGPGPGAVRAVLLGGGDVRRRRAGQLRGGERVP